MPSGKRCIHGTTNFKWSTTFIEKQNYIFNLTQYIVCLNASACQILPVDEVFLLSEEKFKRIMMCEFESCVQHRHCTSHILISDIVFNVFHAEVCHVVCCMLNYLTSSLLCYYTVFAHLCWTSCFSVHMHNLWAGIFKQSMGARNRVGKGLSYRPARLHRLAEFIP